MQETTSYNEEDHIIGNCSSFTNPNHLSILKMLFLHPELQPQGGDVEGGAQVGGVGEGVHPLKAKICHWLLIDHPTDVRSNRRLGMNSKISMCLLTS